jgi:23S rRNA (adenine2503-C2)-methyltransferase
MAPADVLDCSLAELETWCEGHDLPRYRAAQIAHWVFQRGVRDVLVMQNLPREMRAALAAEYRVGSLAVVHVSRAGDGTRKLLLRAHDNATIESVLIPDGARLTLCVSTQVGCAMDCGFCATATLGFHRHLRRGEIVEQFLLARELIAAEALAATGTIGEGAAEARELGRAADAPDVTAAGVAGRPAQDAAGAAAVPERITNLVFMGMGEPLHNYAGTVGAIETLTASWGADVSPRRITVSTVGLVPEMERLLTDTRVNLAVSLTAVDQELRRRLMPVSKRYPVATLLEACRALPLPRRKRITFEYVLLARVNDRPAQARELARALAGIRCKVNLIAYNPFPGGAYERSGDLAVARFQDVLRSAGVHATVRESRGRDIAAACGQLVAAEERDATASGASPAA